MTVRCFLPNPSDPGRERTLQVPTRDPFAGCRTAKDDFNASKLDVLTKRHVITKKAALLNNELVNNSSQLNSTTIRLGMLTEQ